MKGIELPQSRRYEGAFGYKSFKTKDNVFPKLSWKDMFSAYTWNKTCLTWEELSQYNSSNFVLRIAFLPFQNYSDNFCAENILRILAIEVIHDEVLILISLLNNLLFANILRKLSFLSKNRSGMNVKTFLLRNLIWKLFSFN